MSLGQSRCQSDGLPVCRDRLVIEALLAQRQRQVAKRRRVVL
jgi:hypothetical protein